MRKRFLRSTLLVFLLLTLTACDKTYDTDIYGPTVGALADDEAWEFVDIGAKYSVMLVSNQLIEDGNTNSMSAFCDVYYVVDDKVTNIGRIESVGSEYPIYVDDTGIYSGSDDEICRYIVNDKMCELELAEQGASLTDKYKEANPVLFGYGASGRASVKFL